MRILYDGIIYSYQTAGGISRYFANLISRLPASVTPMMTATRGKGISFPTHPNFELHLRDHRLAPHIGRWAAKAWNQHCFRKLSQTANVSIYHPTYYTSVMGKRIVAPAVPTVLTVHDLIHERFREMLDPDGEHAELKRRAIERADAVICVSENTKADLLEYYRVDEAKISVIYHGSELANSLADDIAFDAEQPYFFYVGSRDRYKNFGLLLDAYRRVVVRRPELGLRVAGPQFTQDELRAIGERGLERKVIHCGQVSDAELAKMYRQSLALVYPSLYEGFGIPPLEAMCCGTAVIASNCSSLPEVVGDAGMLFDPESVEQLTDCLAQIADDRELRAALIQRGHQQAAKFSWERMATETWSVYQQLTKAA